MANYPFTLGYTGEKFVESEEVAIAEDGMLNAYCNDKNCSLVQVLFKGPNDNEWFSFTVRPMPIQDGVLPVQPPFAISGTTVKVRAYVMKGGSVSGAITVGA